MRTRVFHSGGRRVLVIAADQVEALSLLGDVAQHHGEPVVHPHTVLGRRDGSTVGGHLLSGQVWPTLEIIVTEVAVDLVKHLDPQTGLALLPAQPDEGA
jgi:predicted DNA-binding protein with PD1-like motif